MSKILLNDCSQKVTEEISMLLDNGETIFNEHFDENKSLNSYSMIILEAGGNRKNNLERVKKLRKACNFRNIAIIIVDKCDYSCHEKEYVLAGATEVLSLTESPVLCRQILQSHLIPSRQPLEEETEYIKPFIEATHNVMKTMAGMEPELKEIYFNNELRIFGDVSGVIGLSGSSGGTAVITFYWNLAREIILRMMGGGVKDPDLEMIHDGVGELVNMISGSAKKALVGTPYYFHLSIPSVVVGSGHTIGHPDNASVAVLVFNVKDNSFVIQVSIVPANHKG
ncbi:MAG: chemotaxis protein CheX [Thermodesulfobacteriota bacterium]|nr:chemotaxis protein CheX [Thermodesulfobacteriota bacterium]